MRLSRTLDGSEGKRRGEREREREGERREGGREKGKERQRLLCVALALEPSGREEPRVVSV